MIIDNQQEIIDAIYQEDSISEIYFGSDLVFIKRKEEEEAPVFDPDKLYIKGKFTDDSIEKDWYVKTSFSNTEYSNKSIADYVDPETKEFDAVLTGITFGGIFYNNSKLERIDLIHIPESLKQLYFVFNGCESLLSANLKYLNTDNVTDLQYLFCNCNNIKNLDFSTLNTENNQNLYCFLNGCKNLETVKFGSFNTENVKDITNCFTDCEKLKELNISSFNTGKLEKMNGAFNALKNLKTLHLGNNFDLSKLTDGGMLFVECEKLKNITGTITNLGLSWNTNQSLHIGSPLTNESAMVLINGLANVTSNRIIQFRKETYETLTEEQKIIATDKGWTIINL